MKRSCAIEADKPKNKKGTHSFTSTYTPMSSKTSPAAAAITPLAIFDLTTTTISSQEMQSEITLKSHTINMQREEMEKMRKVIKTEKISAETPKVIVETAFSDSEMEMQNDQQRQNDRIEQAIHSARETPFKKPMRKKSMPSGAPPFPRASTWEACRLASHMTGTHKNGKRLFNCSKCRRSFGNATDRDAHNKWCCTPSYECYICRMNIQQRSKLKMHMATHDTHECHACKKSFRSVYALQYHLTVSHGDTNKQASKQKHAKSKTFQPIPQQARERPFECTICGNRYAVKKNLREHLDAKHNPNGKKFECSVAKNPSEVVPPAKREPTKNRRAAATKPVE